MAKRPSFFNRLGLGARIGVGVFLVALVGGGYYVAFHSEVESSIDSARSEEKRLQGDLAAAEAAKQAYQNDLAELADREQRQRELSKILPETTEYPAFLSAVQGVANVAGISLSAWTPQEEVPEEFYARVPMRLKLGGRYHQVAKFFYQIGQLDRIINVENISITEPARVGDDVTLQVDALATAFHLIEPKDKSAEDDKKSRKHRK